MKKTGIFLIGAVISWILLRFSVYAAASDPITSGWGTSRGRVIYEDSQTEICIDSADLQKLYELAR